MILGLDYASVDGDAPPAFNAAAAAGIKFVVIRATWGTYVDPCLDRDRSAAHAAGLTVGAYMFLRFPELGHPAPSVADQVAAFTGAYTRLSGELPPTLDVEFPGRGLVDTGLSPSAALALVEEAVGRLGQVYPEVMIYTSARVWSEDLRNLPSATLGARPLWATLGARPLWVKTPYVYRARQPADLAGKTADSVSGLIPPPWHCRAWIQQFQGDAVGVPGFTGTVDVNRFLPSTGDTTDPRADWIHARLKGKTIQEFQDAAGLKPDGVVGPVTFAALASTRV